MIEEHRRRFRENFPFEHVGFFGIAEDIEVREMTGGTCNLVA